MMASERYPDGFGWDKATKRYRNKATGRFLARKTIQDRRDEFIDTNKKLIEDYTAALADGTRSLRSWEEDVWGRIEIVWTAEFMAGRGGRNAMTSADRALVGRMLTSQRRTLRGFAEDVAGGSLSEREIANRAKLYLNASRLAFERGKARAWDVALPAYPGDGSTLCLMNCNCHWSVSDRTDRVEWTWVLTAVESCDTCLDYAVRWAPYVVMKG